MTITPPTTRPDAAPTRRAHGTAFGYLPGIDGLRAIAVMAVILYHVESSKLSGGFLGVEVFFVISGYLITSLLLSEKDRSGGVSLRDFWRRRARRLLPALYALLVAVVVMSATIAPDTWSRLPGDLLAALGYYSNWWQIFHHDSYFVAAGRPSLVQHLWSLAVEEQFYLVWPLVFALVGRRLRRPVLAVAAVGVGVASAIWMAVLWSPAVDASRVYLGTDTRLSGLMLGIALAAIWPAHRFRAEHAAPRAGLALDAFGLAGAAVLAWALLRVNEFDPFVYRGGFLVVDLATVAVIAVAVHPSARLGKVLGAGALVWIGRRSYGLYLWHWPVFQVTRPDLDVPIHGWALMALRLAITFALAELSYRFVEAPIRDGTLGRRWHSLRPAWASADRTVAIRFLVAPVVVVALVLVLLGVGPIRSASTSVSTLASSQQVIDDTLTTTTAPPEHRDSTTVAPGDGATRPAPTTTPPTAQASTTEASTTSAPAQASTTQPATTSTAPTVTVQPQEPAVPGGVTALGDSVMVGAATALRSTLPGVNINARVARQFDEALVVLSSMASSGQLQGTLLVHLGTNGWFTDAQFDQLMRIVGNRRVFFVTTHAARSWEDIVNQRLGAGVSRWPNARLIDWHTYASSHPDFFVADGIHLDAAGIDAYATFIRETIDRG
jgi:peptidoglycan/LPS O-acetylase OafA/YrhL